MDSDNDPLAGEISLSGELTETGVKASAKSRMLSAFDRLVGNLVDWPSTYIERKNRLLRAKTLGEEKIINSLTQAAVARIGTDEPLANRAIDAHFSDLVRKQENKEAVALEALEHLKESVSSESPDSDATELEDDWMNFFASYAEKASSERMRRLWGSILAGEINNPGTFSFTTLRIASEIDPYLAAHFQDLACKRFGQNLVKPDDLRGQLLNDLLSLEAAGLIQEVSGFYQVKVGTGDGDLQLRLESFLIRAQFPKQQSQTISIPAMRLTKSGMQLCSIFPYDAEGAARLFASAIAKHATEVTLHGPIFENGIFRQFSPVGIVIKANATP